MIFEELRAHVAGRLLVLVALIAFASGSSTGAAQPTLELGKDVYEITAGGVGCAYCHGLTGRGDGTAGVDAPYIAGASESTLRNSLAGAVPLMNFIALTEEELLSTLMYLQFLANPSAFEVRAAPPPPTIDTITINVEVSDAGFKPDVIRLPVGARVQIILRNRTFDEHHFRIVGLVPDEIMWAWNQGDEQPLAAAGHEAHDHHAHAHGHAMADASEAPADDHDDHEHPLVLMRWRATSPAGITPTGAEVHLWAHTYSPGGGRDLAIFTTTMTGTFVIDNPLRPGMTARLVIE
jgi:hypothetical protein